MAAAAAAAAGPVPGAGQSDAVGAAAAGLRAPRRSALFMRRRGGVLPEARGWPRPAPPHVAVFIGAVRERRGAARGGAGAVGGRGRAGGGRGQQLFVWAAIKPVPALFASVRTCAFIYYAQKRFHMLLLLYIQQNIKYRIQTSMKLMF